MVSESWTHHWAIAHRDLPTTPGWCYKRSNTHVKRVGDQARISPTSPVFEDAIFGSKAISAAMGCSKNTHMAQCSSLQAVLLVRLDPEGRLFPDTQSQHFLKGLVLHSHWFHVVHEKEKSFSQTPISFLHRGTHKGGQNWGDCSEGTCSQQGKKWQSQQDAWPAGCMASLWRMERKMGRVHQQC